LSGASTTPFKYEIDPNTPSMRPASRSRSCCSVVLYWRISITSLKYCSRKLACTVDVCTPITLPLSIGLRSFSDFCAAARPSALSV
jgi:hypothetical protein